MFWHYCVILKEFIVNTLPSYTSKSNAVVGNIVLNFKLFHTGFQILMSEIFKILKLSYL